MLSPLFSFVFLFVSLVLFPCLPFSVSAVDNHFYSPNGDFYFRWSIDTEANTITVFMSSNNQGYLRMTLADPAVNGKFDIWTAWKSPSGVSFLFDQAELPGLSLADDERMSPPGQNNLDPQPAALTSTASVKFKRDLSTSDTNNDVSIGASPIEIRWSYGRSACSDTSHVCPTPEASGSGTIHFQSGEVSGGSKFPPGSPSIARVDPAAAYYFKGVQGQMSYEYSIDRGYRFLTMKLSARTTGYLGIGIAKSPISMTGADYWLGFAPDGAPDSVIVVDAFSPNNLNPVVDVQRQGTDDLQVPPPIGSQKDGLTEFTFVRPLVTNDPTNDWPITKKPLLMHAVWHDEDCSDAGCKIHRSRAASTEKSGCIAFTLNFATGDSSELKKPIDPAKILTICVSGIFFLYLVFRYGWKLNKCCNQEWKRNVEMVKAQHDQANQYYVSNKGPNGAANNHSNPTGTGQITVTSVQMESLGGKNVATEYPGASPTAKPRFSIAPKPLNDTSSAIQRWISSWVMLKAENGVPYYYNPTLQQTAWTIPPMPDYAFEDDLKAELEEKPTDKKADEKAAPSVLAASYSGWLKQNSSNKSKLRSIPRWRIPFTQWNLIELFIVLGYLGLNFICYSMVDRDNYPIEYTLGYLALANSVLLMIPASRNSIFVWALGFPFDQIIQYHRRLAMLTVGLVTAHFIAFLDKWKSDGVSANDAIFNNRDNAWGFFAWLAGIIIALFSLPIIRRKLFELFYFTHFLFVLFFVGLYFHIPNIAQPYVIAVAIIYGLDRFVRFFWGLLPKETVLIKLKGDDMLQVVFPKSWFVRRFGLYKPGQYVFLNFPAFNPPISFFEWHPYTLSSGPDEYTGEVHIRALGNHTRALMAWCKKRQQTVEWDKKIPNLLVRVDGPYGNLRMNYRRFPVLVLFGGGIGITPILSICKDVYQLGDLSSLVHNKAMHAIQAVYVIWVIPEEKQFCWFADEFLRCFTQAELNGKLFPPFNLWVYFTRKGKRRIVPGISEQEPAQPQSQPQPQALGTAVAVDSKSDKFLSASEQKNDFSSSSVDADHNPELGPKDEPGVHPTSQKVELPPEYADRFDPNIFQCGRPDFDVIADSITADHANASQFYFACGHRTLVNAVWDTAVAQERKGNRVDFHKETFDW